MSKRVKVVGIILVFCFLCGGLGLIMPLSISSPISLLAGIALGFIVADWMDQDE